MVFRAILVLVAALAFAASPFLLPDFGGYDPSQFPVPLTDPPVQPAGYAFAIWGGIYLWLIVMSGYGLLARATDVGWDRARWPLLVSLGVGALWLSVALASPLWATALIWVMLLSALMALSRTPKADRWWLREAVGLYAGWLTAASAVSVGLVASGWDVPPFGPEGWAIAALILALVIGAAILQQVASMAYGAALIWALIAVTVQNGPNLVGLLAIVGAVMIAALTLRAWRRT